MQADTTAEVRKLLDHEASSADTASRYRKLAVAARELGLEYEAERAEDEADEFERDAEAIREQLVALGYTPEEG